MGLGLSVFPADISVGQTFVLFCFPKPEIFCLKKLHPDFSVAKKASPTYMSHCRRGEGILGPPVLSLNPLCSSQGGKDIAEAKRRGSSKHGQNWMLLPGGWEENPGPCSSTVQWYLGCCCCLAAHGFAHAKSCACWALLWDFLSVFGVNRKSGRYQDMGKLVMGWEPSRTQGRVAPCLSRLGSRRQSWGAGCGVWGMGPPSPVQLRKVHFLPWCYAWLEEFFFPEDDNTWYCITSLLEVTDGLPGRYFLKLILWRDLFSFQSA